MALFFDGNADVVSTATTDWCAGTNFAISFWFKPTSLSLSDVFIQQFVSSVGGCRARAGSVAATTFDIVVCQGGTNVVGGVASALAAGTWRHWFIKYDGSQSTSATRLKLWRDGVAQTLSFSGAVPTSVDSSGAAFEAGENSASAAHGSIANVMVWSTLVPDAIGASQWLSYKPLYTDSAFLWWPFDDGAAGVDYAHNNATSVSNAVVSPDSPGISLGHPIVVIE
jgi:hypothetical protein